MTSDDELFAELLAAVADLEQSEAWPPSPELVFGFELAVDGVGRRFLDDPRGATDGYVLREMTRDADGVWSAGEFRMLSAGAGADAPPTRRAELQLSSTAGGWLRVASEDDQRAFEQLTRRQRAAASRLEQWTFTVEVPPAAEARG